MRLLWLIGLCAMFLTAADVGWNTKPAAEWTEEEARQVLSRSPWAREITAGIARRLTEDELREGGQMGQPHGVGYDGVDPKNSGVQFPDDLYTNRRTVRSSVQRTTLRLRWESALPVRLAELKSHEIEPPTLEGEGYRIAVYGVPGAASYKGDPARLGDPLKDHAFLRRIGKRDVKPLRVEVFQRTDGWVVVYLFPLSAELTQKDGTVEFNASIGRIVVVYSFDLAEMQYLGRLEL